MEMEKKALEALTSFGLTEYEAKVYLTLVLKGVQKASTLADMSDIPRPHVYSVIKLLHEKGLIIIIPEKVTKYQALPIDMVLNKLLEERMESIRSPESIGNDLASLVKEKGAPSEIDDSEKVQLYSGRWAIVDLIHKVLGRANASCEITTNDKSFVLTAGAYESDLAGMDKKGVQARFLLPIEKDTLPMIDNLSRRAMVRHLDSMDNLTLDIDVSGNTFLRVVVIDDTEALFVRALPGSGDESAIWTSQKEMARMIRLMFRHMWWNAPDMETKKTEIETGWKPEHLTPIYGDAEMEKTQRMVLSRSKRELCCVLSREQVVYNLSTLVTETQTASAKGMNVMLLISIRSSVNRGQMLGGVRGEIAEDEVTFNLLGESAVTSSGGSIGVYTNPPGHRRAHQGIFRQAVEELRRRRRTPERDQPRRQQRGPQGRRRRPEEVLRASERHGHGPLRHRELGARSQDHRDRLYRLCKGTHRRQKGLVEQQLRIGPGARSSPSASSSTRALVWLAKKLTA
jgi:HTH-type transcriptional regulator, sugar sensing transcriptional regulator